MEMWNAHRIRPRRLVAEDYGVPNVMYSQPMIYGKVDCFLPLPCEPNVLDAIADRYTDPPLLRGSTEEFVNLVSAFNKRFH